MDAITLSADAGLVAVTCVSLSICFGLLMAVRYSPVRFWPHRRIDIFRVHRVLAYITFLAIGAHVVLLLLDRRVHFRLQDILLPIHSPLQPFQNTLGAIALYLLVIVLLSSWWRIKLGRRTWKSLHYLVYPAGVLLFIHGVLTDSDLRTGKADLLDGEKVYIMLCFLAVLLASLFALRLRRIRARR
jgi:DMSO/TMAO reductase YedYZ heme-binding membrane subunit